MSSSSLSHESASDSYVSSSSSSPLGLGNNFWTMAITPGTDGLFPIALRNLSESNCTPYSCNESLILSASVLASLLSIV